MVKRTLKEQQARAKKLAALYRSIDNDPEVLAKKVRDAKKLYGGPTPADNPYAGNSTGSSSGSSMGDSIGQLDLSEEEVTNIKIAKKESDKER